MTLVLCSSCGCRFKIYTDRPNLPYSCECCEDAELICNFVGYPEVSDESVAAILQRRSTFNTIDTNKGTVR